MKFQRGFCGLFCLLFSLGVFAQTKPEMDAAKLAQARADRIKADILQEIQSLSTPEQISFYANFGTAFWIRDRRESLFWLRKSVEIATNPATAYTDNVQKLKILSALLGTILKRDLAMTDRVFAVIKEIKIDEADEKQREIANAEYLSLARLFLGEKRDEKLAFEFALLSLTGKKPALNWNAFELFEDLKKKQSPLADKYFAAMIAAARNSGDNFSIRVLFHHFEDHLLQKNTGSQPNFLSAAQKRALLELVFPFIQNELEALVQKKIEHCDATRKFGVMLNAEFKRFLPEKFLFIEQAIAVCNAAALFEWAKPDFLKKPRQTVQDFLDRAKEVGDKRVEAFYLYLAALEAYKQSNHRQAIEILDSIGKEFRDFGWIISRINVADSLFYIFLQKENFPEIAKLLEDSPPEYRAGMIVRSFSRFPFNPNPENNKYVAELFEKARADFNRVEEFPANIMYLNPTLFADLPGLYLRYGLEEEALAVHGEAVNSFNRVIKNLPANLKEKNIIPRLAYFFIFKNQASKETQFVDCNFERIYENIGRIENLSVRLTDRLMFLREIMAMVPANLIR